jgi:integrase
MMQQVQRKSEATRADATTVCSSSCLLSMVGTLLSTSFAQGVPPRVITEVLGHSEIGVTMNTYTHVLPELRQEAADAIDDLFGA